MDEFKKLQEEKRQRQLFRELQKFVNQLDSAESLSTLTAAVEKISQVLESIEMPQQSIAELTAALQGMVTNTPSNNGDITRAMAQFGDLIAKNLEGLQDVIQSGSTEKLLQELSDHLKLLKEQMIANQKAEWEFNIFRDGNGDMDKVQVRRIK